MGNIFLEHSNGLIIYSCRVCNTNLTNMSHLISTAFKGITGRAYLFKRVVNIRHGNVQDRVLLSGRHKIREVFCKKCEEQLGWMYEFASEKSERYKEGKVVLEVNLIKESYGMTDTPGMPSPILGP